MKDIKKIKRRKDRQTEREKRRAKWVTALAAIVIFSTTYSMILPAITLEKGNTQGMEGISLEEEQQEGAYEEAAQEAFLQDEYEEPLHGSRFPLWWSKKRLETCISYSPLVWVEVVAVVADILGKA